MFDGCQSLKKISNVSTRKCSDNYKSFSKYDSRKDSSSEDELKESFFDNDQSISSVSWARINLSYNNKNNSTNNEENMLKFL